MPATKRRVLRTEPAARAAPTIWTGYDPPPSPLSPNRRFTKRQENLLDRLQDIVFAEGFAHLRVADIRSRIGCAWATLYKIAARRDELILLVVDRWHQRLIRESMRAALRHRDAVSLLTEWHEIYRTAVAGVSLRFTADVDRNVAVAQLVDRYTRYYLHTTSRTLEIGIEQGLIRDVDPLVAAHVWLGSNDRLTQTGLAGDTRLGVEAVTELRRILFEGLLRREDEPSKPRRAGKRKRR